MTDAPSPPPAGVSPPTADAVAPLDDAAPTTGAGGRIIVIDVLRGLAILWVIVFHLHADMTSRVESGSRLYPALRDRVTDLQPLLALDALGELILGLGYQGVPVFMMLSGLSLVLNAERRAEPPILRGYWQRFRRVVPPYWFGVLLLVSTAAIIALVQTLLHEGSYSYNWHHVRANPVATVHFSWPDVGWALSVFGWLFREDADQIATVPVTVGSLWFVQLLLQYYLVFPFALKLLRRIGPWWFIGVAILVTVLARGTLIALTINTLPELYRASMMGNYGIFRFSEFGVGMALGYLLVHRREQTAEWLRSPVDIAGLFVIAALLQAAGVLLDGKADTFTVLGAIAVQIALALYMAPLLFKAPGRLEASSIARGLAWMGVLSFMALIVNDSMRYYNTLLRAEDIPDALYVFFIVVVYVPGGMLLAYPPARLFGLVPGSGRRGAARDADGSTASLGLQAAGGS